MNIFNFCKKTVLVLALLIAVTNISFLAYQSYRIHVVKQDLAFKENAILKPVKFFQIGFSKCATKSLADFFQMNAVPTIHHDGGNLALNMFANYKKGMPLIAEVYASFYGFFDMERLYDEPLISVPKSLFKELDQQYPGSKFILNTRNKQAWLVSKANHPAYHHNMRWIDLHAKFLHKSKEEVLALWSQEWDDHYSAVLDYFKDRPNDLLVFDIDKDPAKKICEFFKDNFKLNPKYYEHKNKSIDRDREKVIDY